VAVPAHLPSTVIPEAIVRFVYKDHGNNNNNNNVIMDVFPIKYRITNLIIVHVALASGFEVFTTVFRYQCLRVSRGLDCWLVACSSEWWKAEREDVVKNMELWLCSNILQHTVVKTHQ
jgi:hypothetical protein